MRDLVLKISCDLDCWVDIQLLYDVAAAPLSGWSEYPILALNVKVLEVRGINLLCRDLFYHNQLLTLQRHCKLQLSA